MSTLNQNIKKAIQESLSGQVAGELSSVLAEYEVLKANEPNLEKQIKQLEKEKQNYKLNYENKRHDYEILLKETHDLENRKRVLQIEENKLEVTKMQIKLNMVEQSKSEILTLVDKVFSVPTVTVTNNKNIMKNIPISTDAYLNSVTDNINKTTSTTESK